MSNVIQLKQKEYNFEKEINDLKAELREIKGLIKELVKN